MVEAVAVEQDNISKFGCGECQRDFETQEALGMHNSAKHQIGQESKKINPKVVWGVVGIIGLIAFAGYLIYFNNGSLTSAVVLSESTGLGSSGDIQKIILSYKNSNYYPNDITVKAGIPVEITLDNSVGGCFRSFVIQNLGVREYSNNPSEKIKFIPTQKGTFEFACGMGMGTGTINVV